MLCSLRQVSCSFICFLVSNIGFIQDVHVWSDLPSCFLLDCIHSICNVFVSFWGGQYQRHGEPVDGDSIVFSLSAPMCLVFLFICFNSKVLSPSIVFSTYTLFFFLFNCCGSPF